VEVLGILKYHRKKERKKAKKEVNYLLNCAYPNSIRRNKKSGEERSIEWNTRRENSSHYNNYSELFLSVDRLYRYRIKEEVNTISLNLA